MVSESTVLLAPLAPFEQAISIGTDSAISDHASHPPSTSYRHIWVISGPAGCGKTSLAQSLHERFGFPFLEGDTFHTPGNIAKMSNGHPLTDTERWDWLVDLREECLQTLKTSSPSASESSGIVVTCSALKRKYRDVIRVASYHNPLIKVHFIFLNTNADLLRNRVRARTNHYMKAHMVGSQIESLEQPQHDEVDILNIDAASARNHVLLAAANHVLETYSTMQI